MKSYIATTAQFPRANSTSLRVQHDIIFRGSRDEILAMLDTNDAIHPGVLEILLQRDDPIIRSKALRQFAFVFGPNLRYQMKLAREKYPNNFNKVYQTVVNYIKYAPKSDDTSKWRSWINSDAFPQVMQYLYDNPDVSSGYDI